MPDDKTGRQWTPEEILARLASMNAVGAMRQALGVPALEQRIERLEQTIARLTGGR